MKRKEAFASTETLMYVFSRSELVCSALIMLVVSIFAFFFASNSTAGIQEGSSVTSEMWHWGGGHIRQLLGPDTIRLFARGGGSLLAGFSASVCFVVIRHLLFWGIRPLRLLEYYRIRCRLFLWTMCIVLSVALSRFFLELFVPVTLGTVNVMMSCLAAWLAIHFLRVNRPIFLMIEYALLGVLSALSITGFVMLMVSTLFLHLAKTRVKAASHAKWMSDYGYGRDAYGGYGGYGYGYGDGEVGYGSSSGDAPEKDEQDTLSSALLEERLRLVLILFFFLGFVFTVALIFGSGIVFGSGMKSVALDWMSWFAAELRETLSSSELMMLLCGMAISVIFVLYRFNRMLDVEYYLKSKDVFRLASSVFLAAFALIGIGRKNLLLDDSSPCEIQLIPLAVQVLAGFAMLLATVVFLVNLQCRKYYSADADTEDGKTIRQYNRMKFLLLLFFDVAPVVLLVVATSYIWRSFI